MSEEKTGLREARADCGFRGLWIPREIWFDDRLTLLDKVIFARISALDNGEGCYATNKYLAKFCGCVVTRVSMIVSKLIKFGLIEKSNSDTEQRVLRVCVGVLSDTPSPKENTPSLKENPPSLKENPPFSKREPPTSYKNTVYETIDDNGVPRPQNPNQVVLCSLHKIDDMFCQSIDKRRKMWYNISNTKLQKGT